MSKAKKIKYSYNRHTATFIILAILSLAMIFPFVWMILSSFKTAVDVYQYPPRWIPSTWNWKNYSTVFEMIPFLRYYINSIVTTIGPRCSCRWLLP